MSKQIDQPIKKYDSIWSLFIRVFWTLLGNIILLISAIVIIQHKGETFHTADIVFWVTAAALLLARYLDIKFWDKSDAAGEPAPMSHWRKYAAILLICSIVVWALSHITNYLNK